MSSFAATFLLYATITILGIFTTLSMTLLDRTSNGIVLFVHPVGEIVVMIWSYLTMTGFSDPATNPNPISLSLSRVTCLGSGISSGSIVPHLRGSSYVVVLFRWLKEKEMQDV
jgi:hypothetical protein